MTEQAATRAKARWPMPLLAAFLVGLLCLLIVSGQWPELRSKVAFAPKGLVTTAPADVRRVEIRSGSDGIALLRRAGVWTIEGLDGAVTAELGSHIETALRLVSVSEPAREIPASDLTAASYAAFGLDPPVTVGVIEANDGSVTSVNFGALNPASTSHYVRLGGRPAVYLMQRHVSEEWRVVSDMARRLRGQAETGVATRGKTLLLPVSMAQVWALEIVFAGKLTRFERDPYGKWFRHLGQHNHEAGSVVHVADPEQARIIDAALRALDATAVETRVGPAKGAQLARYGLDLPSLIVLVYSRDSFTPLAKLELGALSDSLDRYARLAPDGAVVTVAEFEMRRLTELLRAVGAAS
ncbi:MULTISPECIES: DUF4340 domain-containing protein [unclassified Bradyrhizobium]|uniref:DUF4340 domain-containing protein n=1 Tax=unclassified Bradyrhizobium TaxID=2631580 RepID=UPI001FF8F6BE|nr:MULTISPECIES: DUF4340 domain-containing protein [unclassified Bradyrhizobium]MCK1712089.1 hypothetical protein [Bradyrhizobium sp. 143]MCK1732065.1 hypothetical protein [Bradyrhizobium sp. 142]